MSDEKGEFHVSPFDPKEEISVFVPVLHFGFCAEVYGKREDIYTGLYRFSRQKGLLRSELAEKFEEIMENSGVDYCVVIGGH